MSVPRPRGRALSELELLYLQLLLDVRARARSRLAEYDARLEDFVLRCREDGASARSMAQELDVSAGTIHHWTELGRHRRDGD